MLIDVGYDYSLKQYAIDCSGLLKIMYRRDLEGGGIRALQIRNELNPTTPESLPCMSAGHLR